MSMSQQLEARTQDGSAQKSGGAQSSASTRSRKPRRHDPNDVRVTDEICVDLERQKTANEDTSPEPMLPSRCAAAKMC